MPRYRAIADYYDAEYEGSEMLLQDVPFFLGHLPARRRLKVLELAVGTARAAIPIAQAGHRVTGVDYAPGPDGVPPNVAAMMRLLEQP